jgi:hypothetical protein
MFRDDPPTTLFLKQEGRAALPKDLHFARTVIHDLERLPIIRSAERYLIICMRYEVMGVVGIGLRAAEMPSGHS